MAPVQWQSSGNPVAIQWQTNGKPVANPVANLLVHVIPAGGMSNSETSISITKSQLSKPPQRGIRSKRRFAHGFASGLSAVCHWIATALALDCLVRVSIRHGLRPAWASLYGLSCAFAAFSWGWFGSGWRGPFGSVSGAGLGPRLGPFLGAHLGQVWATFGELFWVTLPLLLVRQVRPKRGGP